ncbi:hypothetical protein DRJ19_01820 [Candidatus Woesearchaeota archaeon]|nr:MAG: hypothetical protein DRJ19_01820 [Candidatus Woesearchaeota archaeon]
MRGRFELIATTVICLIMVIVFSFPAISFSKYSKSVDGSADLVRFVVLKKESLGPFIKGDHDKTVRSIGLAALKKKSKAIKEKIKSEIKEEFPEIRIDHEFSLFPGFIGEVAKDRFESLKKYAEKNEFLIAENVKLRILSRTPSEFSDMIGANFLWNKNLTGKNITVALIDTGIDYTHPDLGNCSSIGAECRVIDGYDFVNDDSDPMDDNGHGTHCAGIIGANGTVKGVAPSVEFLAVKVCNESGSCHLVDIIAGLDWSVSHGADIISMSIGGFDFCKGNDGYSLLSKITNDIVQLGIPVIVAAGNDAGIGRIGSPGDAFDVITVGAYDDSFNDVADFSSRGPSMFGRFDPDLIAPGVNINSTFPNSAYELMDGTSMATPFVTGCVALMLEMNSSMDVDEIRARLIHNAEDIGAAWFEQGGGLINVSKSVENKLYSEIDDDVAWELNVLPGMNYSTNLLLRNGFNESLNVSFLIGNLTSAEGSIFQGQFELPSSITLNSSEEREVEIKVSVFDSNVPGTYGGYLILNQSNGFVQRIPVVITIPLVGNGKISSRGYVEDFLLYRIIGLNATSVELLLNWSSPSDDLDLLLYSSDGVLIAESSKANTTNETIVFENPRFFSYWVGIYFFNASSPVDFDLSVSFRGNLSIEPNLVKINIKDNETKNVSFTLKSSGTFENLTININALRENTYEFVNGTIRSNESLLAWRSSNSSAELNRTQWIEATLVWTNFSNDLDLEIVCSNGSDWVSTDYSSIHFNPLNMLSFESIWVPIRYYAKECEELGINIINNGDTDESFELNVTTGGFFDDAGVKVTPEFVQTLFPSDVINISVVFNGSEIDGEEEYLLAVFEGKNELSHAVVKVHVESVQNISNQTNVTDSSDNDSGSGGGGGGSSIRKSTGSKSGAELNNESSKIVAEKLKSSETVSSLSYGKQLRKRMKEKEEFVFQLDVGKKKEMHKILVSRIEKTRATIIIHSVPITVTLNVGQFMKFDLNKDGFYDLFVWLNNIYYENKEVELSLKNIHEPVSKVSKHKKSTKKEPLHSVSGMLVAPSSIEHKESPKGSFYLAVLLFGAIIILTVYLLRKRYTKF